ncbi:MAG: glutaredoxin family protein [archaeon]
MKIKLFCVDDSHECLVVRNYLRARNVDFEEVNVDKSDNNPEMLNELDDFSGEKKFPIIKINNQFIVGFKQEELRSLIL